MKIGLSTCGGKLNNKNFFENCAKAGIDCVEVTLGDSKCAGWDYKNTRKLADEYGVELWSYHLPFSPFSTNDISSTKEEKRRNTVELQKSLINKVGEIGIKHFVIHPSAEPIEPFDRRERLIRSKESLSELQDEADKFGGVICVEDLPRTCLGRNSYDIRELIRDDDRLKVCFDTNHLLGEYIPEFIRNVGDRIVTLHVSDYDFWNERHWLPGEGDIDWNELYTELVKAGYDGPWLYEVSFDAPWSIKRDRDLTPGDFVRNANEIFRGEKPIPVGKPIEILSFWPE